MNMTVRTRFAPSPTGYLHIGGVRTALFCWLFAKRNNGHFILRIDDTDAERNVDEALQPILDGLKWLGITWDEGPDIGGPHAPYYQSKRSENYKKAVEKLLASGHAYRDYATTEELAQERKEAEQNKVPFIYSRKWMANTPEDNEKFLNEGRKPTVRLKMPREGSLTINDIVRGEVTFEWSREQDHVIQRADGTCLYHLASVVDDADMEITHVIRAEEHLSNTPRQVFIAQSLNYSIPIYAHLPFVAEPGSKNKLSKRKLQTYLKNQDFLQIYEHGHKIAKELNLKTTLDTFNPVITEFYEQVGYLPEAIINYLALVGWSLDDHTEILSKQELIDNFSLERVVKGSASFDSNKLWSFQDHYMKQVPIEEKAQKMLSYLLIDKPTEKIHNTLLKAIEAAGIRLKVYGDIIAYADFFFRDVKYDETAFEKRLLKSGAKEILLKYRDKLFADGHLRIMALDIWDSIKIESLTHEFLREQNLKIGDLVHAVRVAVTGKAVGPGLYDCLAILGKQVTLERLERAISEIQNKQNQEIGGS